MPHPLAVVREMVSAVRPGGRVILVDDDHELLRLWPACPELDRVWAQYWQRYHDRGLDPLVGRRLTELLRRAGARPTRATSVFFGACRGMPVFDLVVDNLIGVLESAAADLEQSGRLPRAELAGAVRALAAWRSGEAATVWYSLPLAEGTR